MGLTFGLFRKTQMYCNQMEIIADFGNTIFPNHAPGDKIMNGWHGWSDRPV